MNDTFTGKAAPMTQQGFNTVVQILGVDSASLWAVLTVETRGFGFLPDRRPKILFERHIFHQRTQGRFSAAFPDISNSVSGGYIGGAAEYGRLARAISLDRKAALESASWGLGQIMGFNALDLRYLSAEEMAQQFCDGEDAQLKGSQRFISKNGALAQALQQGKWERFAFFYNGKNYAKNNYHTKLATYDQLYRTKGTPDIEVRTAQALLSFLGFDPRGVDGVIGNGTLTAVLAFQKARGIAPTATLDSTTWDELKRATGF